MGPNKVVVFVAVAVAVVRDSRRSGIFFVVYLSTIRMANLASESLQIETSPKIASCAKYKLQFVACDEARVCLEGQCQRQRGKVRIESRF